MDENVLDNKGASIVLSILTFVISAIAKALMQNSLPETSLFFLIGSLFLSFLFFGIFTIFIKGKGWIVLLISTLFGYLLGYLFSLMMLQMIV